MRKIQTKIITKAAELLCNEANFKLPNDVLEHLKQNFIFESNNIAKGILSDIIENANIALNDKIPLCQDTGSANFFLEIGKEVYIEGRDSIYEAINRGTALGYTKNYLRKSIVLDPIIRKNSNDNTPANIYISITSGDKIKITFLAKGGGSDNASVLKMFNPTSSWQEIEDFIVDSIKNKGKNSCPPLIIGIGIGGSFSNVSFLSLKALLRNIGSSNKNKFYDEKEKELLNTINNLNIGPMNLGGKTTSLAVFIETKPTHIASLPVAVNFQCHSYRKRTIII
ncbi:MAG: fumarate hydratase [Endomicrobium sp.]|nr:fumarate hydratase [Endomicrobium sp.]